MPTPTLESFAMREERTPSITAHTLHQRRVVTHSLAASKRSHFAAEDDSDRRSVPKVAVLIPCYNEGAAIHKVVCDFREALPQAEIYVYDNNSKDNTVAMADAAGAIVRRELRQGKGNVVRRMFGDIDADVYVMVDGDGTYAPHSAQEMINKLHDEHLDMVVGCRVSQEQEAYRPGHRFGNALLTGCVARLFGRQFHDILSGYRVFSRRFVRSFPALSSGFETETEITVHALELRMPIAEVATPYGARVAGTESKLNTYRDGFRILRMIAALYRREHPARFYGVIGTAFAVASAALAVPIFMEYFATGLVRRFPTALLCVGLMLCAGGLFGSGLILDTVTHGRRELKRLMYLTCAGFGARSAARTLPPPPIEEGW
jgi:glycosyltransferase involved in cell wall biosynthesis